MTESSDFDQIVYLLQGGGALGAYQVGIFKALSESNYSPDWIISTSIGSINSAIIAGNKPEERLQKLQDFWESIATNMPAPPDSINNLLMERWLNYISALKTELQGQPGFFAPRDLNPWIGLQSSVDKLSYYDTSELRETLQKFVNFDLINEQKIRVSFGAVHITTGRLIYFDNTKLSINVDHVMASSALPPGFPAVNVDGKYYWDGGVHSNTQLNLLLTEVLPVKYLVFMVQLFDSFGMRPTNMDDVMKRLKDINYSSHHRQSIVTYRVIHNLRHAISELAKYLPEEKQQDPYLKHLIDLGKTGIIHATRFHYNGKLSDLSSKDYEFSLASIHDHIKSGCGDAQRVLEEPPWKIPCPKDLGLVLYEVADTPVAEDNPFEEITNYHKTW